MKSELNLVGVLVLALAAGCAGNKGQTSAKAPLATTSGAASADPPSTTSADLDTLKKDRSHEAPVNVSPNLAVSSEIAQACHLSAARATPEFEFDSASIGDEDRTLLGALARCMAEGELKGKSVALTGRTDPRGESEYNMSLGESRADSVRRYLHDLGVAQARLQATSRGELDATGTDESSYIHDRRVDIDLVN